MFDIETNPEAQGVEYQVTKVDPTDPTTKGMVYQVHKVDEVTAYMSGKFYRARIIKDPSDPTVKGKVYQIVLIDDPDDPAVKGKVYNAIITGDTEAVVVGPAVSPLSLPDAVADGLIYVKAFGGTELRNVPEGYDELEYIIHSSANNVSAYIDTGFTPTLNTKARVKFSTDRINYLGFFGARTDPYRFSCTTFSSGTQFAFSLSNNAWSNNKTDVVIGQVYDCIAENGKQTINGTEYEEPVVESWGNCGTFKLLGVNTQGAIVETQQTKFYLCQIWESGVLVRDLVPARRKSDSVIGMYDTVTQTFFTNAGTGTLVAGPKVPVIPAEYTPVEFVTNIQQTSINTGITIDFSKTYEMEIECRAVTGSWYILQSRESTNTNITGITGSISGDTISLVVNGYTVATSDIVRITGRRLYVKATFGGGTGTLYVKNITGDVDDTKTGTYAYGQTNPPAPIHVLGNAAGQMVDINSDIYMVRIKENGATILNCVPVRKRAVAGLYDAENDVFLTAETPSALTAAGEISRGPIPTPDAPIDIWCNNGVLKTAVYNQILYGGNFAYSSSVSSADCSFTVADNVCSMLATAESGRIWLTNAVTNGHKYLYTVDVKSTTATDKIQLRIAGGGIKFSAYSSNWQTISSLYTANSANASLGVADTRSSNWDTVYIKNAMVFDLTLMFGAGNEPTTTSDAFAKIAKVYGQPMEYYPRNDGTVKAYAVGTVETISIHSTNIFNKLTDDTHEGYFVNGSVINNLATSNRTIVISCKPNTKYSFWHTAGVGGCRAFDLPTDTITTGDSATWLTPTSPTYKNANQVTTITTHSDAKKLYICAGRQETGVTRSFDDQLADFMLVEGEVSTATEYQPYFNGGSATCVDLLSVGTYVDEQEMISGSVTRKVGVKVLDGTEDWARTDARVALTLSDAKLGEDGLIPVCSHYVGVNSIIQVSSMPDNSCKINASSNMLMIKDSTHNTDLTAWKQWLADQYAAGTPVIVVYPLATPTSESVAGQPMNVTDGDNIVEITQASIDDLELEVKYLKEG